MSLPNEIQQSTNITTAAATASVSTANAKSHLKVEHSDDDTYIDGLVTAATQEVENITSRTMISTTYDMYLTEFPKDGIVLPFSPVSSITSVKYYNGSNVETTWDSSNYHYNIYEQPCVIRYVDDYPDTYEDRSDAVVVRFVAGYANAAAIPAQLIQAIKMIIGEYYETRSDVPRDAVMTAVKRLTWPHIVHHSPNENQE